MIKKAAILLILLLLCSVCACAPETEFGHGSISDGDADSVTGELSKSPEAPVTAAPDDKGTTKYGGGKSPDTESETLTGKIVEAKDGVILLASDNLGLLTASLSEATLYGLNGANILPDALRAGMEVVLTYSGVILETYPAQPAGVSSLTVISDNADLIGFYCGVFADLYEVDSGLNAGIELLAFDLAGLSNLTKIEKEALVYLIGCRYDMTVLTGTYEELCSAGYIDAESLSFEDGLLITIEVTETSDESFTLNARKWRSGDGAYFFTDCEATLQNGAWVYTVGAEMIS